MNNQGANMKGKITGLITGTLLVITGALPASATVSNTNAQHLTGGQQSTLLLAGNKPSKPDLSPGAKVQARSAAAASPGYQQRGQEINRLLDKLNKMKSYDPKRLKVERDIKKLQKERENIVRRYEDVQRRLNQQSRPRSSSPSYHTAPSRPGSSHSNCSRR